MARRRSTRQRHPATWILGWGLLALGLAGAATPGCTCGKKSGPPPAASTLLPSVPAPAEHVADIVIATPQASWDVARPSLGAGLMFLPRSIGGLLTTVFGLPIRVAVEFDETLPIVGAISAGPNAERPALALAVHVKQGPRLVSQLTLGQHATHAATTEGDLVWLTSKASAQPTTAKVPTTLAVLDNYLVWGASKQDVLTLGGYVVRTVARRPAPGPTTDAQAATPQPDVQIDIPEAAFRGPIPRLADQVLKRLRANPAAAQLQPIVDFDSLAQTLTQLTGDVKKLRLTISFASGGVQLRAQLSAKDDAAKKRLAELATTSPRALLELPEDALVVGTWAEKAATRQAGAAATAATIASALGKELPTEDAQATKAALEGLARGRGEVSVAGLRCSGVGLTGFAHGTVADPRALRKALGDLVAFRKHPAVSARLKELGLSTSAKKLRLERVPHDVFRLRVEQTAADGDAKPDEPPEPIDLLYLVSDKRFIIAAGMETHRTVQDLVAPDPAHALAEKRPLVHAIDSLGDTVWFAVLADPHAMTACRKGRPIATPSSPLVLAAGPGGDPAAEADGWFRLEIDATLLRAALDRL